MAAGVGLLLQNIRKLLLDKAELIGDAKDHIEGIHSDLILFKVFIRDSAEKGTINQTLHILVNEIRSVIDRVEDAIDKFVVENSRIDCAKAIRSVAKETEYIRTKVKEIYKVKQFGFEELHLEELPYQGATEKKAPSVEEANVVGFYEEEETLINRLMNDENRNLDIISIVGMPGLGKTTLARKIYNDPAIEYEFFTRAWAYVSQIYTKREVYISILSTIRQGVDYTNKSDDFITQELHDLLEKGKYFIVMDDVWTAMAWNDLKNVFPDNNKGSRILLTSRNNEVANPAEEPCYLRFLTREESWKLLELKVFGKSKCPPGERQILGEHIADKCEGLPLAIVVIAGILLNNSESNDWWKQVAENVNTFILRDEKQFMEVIAMSYNHLPYHLKSCFLYLGVFPEDYEIPVWKLIRLLIAEGFIEHDEDEGLSLEDVAEACLTDLVNRSLLTASERSSNGHIKTCHLKHVVLYDFCIKEAGKQNFYKEIHWFDEETPVNYRRVCVHSDIRKYIDSKPHNQHVRSFLCFSPDKITLPREGISNISKAFELLKVLDIESIIFDMFPKHLLKLALLRYLAMSCNIRAFPKGISQLWNMQTLIFLTESPTLDLKEEFWKMYRLRHLHTNASALLPLPPSSGETKGIKNVQTLSMISPESCTEHVFARTPHIKKLGVKGKLVVLFDSSFDQVGNLQHLTNLKLYNDDGNSEGRIHSLPPAYKFPKKLTKLTLSNTLLDWEEMQTLGSLETLEVLKLKDYAFEGEIWSPKDGGFLSLKLLFIEKTNLKIWNASKDQFPSLECLILRFCEVLDEVPSDFAEINSFRELELYCTNPRASVSARKVQQKKMLKAVEENKIRGPFKLSIFPPDM